MIHRLPRWVEVGGFALACMAGAVNAIGVLGFEHQAISHLTGTSTLLGVSLTHGRWGEAVHLLLVIVAFVMGAMGSGMLIQHQALHLGDRYGIALALEGCLLFMAAAVLHQGAQMAWLGHLLASAACGLQNAMASTYSAAVLRTTHVSGLFTDIGLMLGAKLRGAPLEKRKLQLYSLLIAGFIVGGALGTFAYDAWQYLGLTLPASAAWLLAVMYWLYLRQKPLKIQRAQQPGERSPRKASSQQSHRKRARQERDEHQSKHMGQR